ARLLDFSAIKPRPVVALRDTKDSFAKFTLDCVPKNRRLPAPPDNRPGYSSSTANVGPDRRCASRRPQPSGREFARASPAPASGLPPTVLPPRTKHSSDKCPTGAEGYLRASALRRHGCRRVARPAEQ